MDNEQETQEAAQEAAPAPETKKPQKRKPKENRGEKVTMGGHSFFIKG